VPISSHARLCHRRDIALFTLASGSLARFWSVFVNGSRILTPFRQLNFDPPLFVDLLVFEAYAKL